MQERSWVGFGGTKGVKFTLEGVEWRLPGHPEPLIIVFQNSVDEDGRILHSTLAYTHIPYPHRLLPDTRKRLANMLMLVEKDEFMEKLAELALDSSE